MTTPPAPLFTVVIIGAGPSGICAGIKLRKAGIENFIILERSPGVGGTWFHNTYPGASCDVNSHLYSYSFRRKPDWSQAFPGQSEILDYFEECVDFYGLRSFIRVNVKVDSASFDSNTGSWRVVTRGGESLRCKMLISAVGMLDVPKPPDLPGLETYRGVTFHSSRWNHDYDLTNRKVAIIGNGASCVQFLPRVAAQVSHLTLFMRTPNYIIPRANRDYSNVKRLVFRWIPFATLFYRFITYLRFESYWLITQLAYSPVGNLIRRSCSGLLQKHIRDGNLRKFLTPSYLPACKRILLSDNFLPALGRANVTVVCDPISPIRRVRQEGIVTHEGELVECDAIIFGTGFKTTDFLSTFTLRNALGESLQHEHWRRHSSAYLGITMPSFPNFFMLLGPNTALGHSSVIYMSECQVNYVVRIIRQALVCDLLYVDVRRDVHEAFNRGLQARFQKTVWGGRGGCRSWYESDDGVITTLWPGTQLEYWLATSSASIQDFVRVRKQDASLAVESLHWQVGANLRGPARVVGIVLAGYMALNLCR